MDRKGSRDLILVLSLFVVLLAFGVFAILNARTLDGTGIAATELQRIWTDGFFVLANSRPIPVRLAIGAGPAMLATVGIATLIERLVNRALASRRP